jgi:integrase
MQHHPSPISGHVQVVPRKRGNVYYLKYRLADGRQVQRRLGKVWTGRGRLPAGYFTRKQAEAELDAILTDARRGVLPGAIRTGVTFEMAAKEWLAYIETDRARRTSTVTGYRSAMNRHLVPTFGELAVENITADLIDAYRQRLVGRGLSARSVNKLLVQMHSIMKRAQRLYGLPANPVAGIERQPVRRSGDFRVLVPVEVAALARAASSELDAAFFTVAAFTGLRLGEMRALRWEDVDFSKRLVHVRHSYTSKTLDAPKSGKVRSVPLIDQAMVALDGLSRRRHFTGPDDLVFGNEVGNYMDESALRRRFVAALKTAKLKPLRLHDLRHSFGTLAVQAFPLSDVKAYMGHADISTTMVYVHHVPQVDAAERLSRVVAGDDFVSRNVSRTGRNSDQLDQTQEAA